MRRFPAHLLLAGVAMLAAGCDQLGIESAADIAARKEADGKAIGGACRHAGRAIEDCYTLNRKADRAAVYAGWREMNEYMRENKVEPVPPVFTADPSSVPRPAEHAQADDGQARPADKPAAKVKKHAS